MYQMYSIHRGLTAKFLGRFYKIYFPSLFPLPGFRKTLEHNYDTYPYPLRKQLMQILNI